MTIEQMIEALNTHPEITVTISATGINVSSPPKITFEEWAWRWAKNYKQGTVKDSTYFNNIERQLRLHLIPRFGPQPLDAILPVDVHEYFCELSEKYTLETQHKIKVCLHALYDAAIENNLCAINPVTRTLKLNSKIPPAEKKIWTSSQYHTAWNFARAHPNGLTIMVLMETGLTRSEMLGLEFKNFDSKHNILMIRNGLVPSKRVKSGKVECIHEGLKTTYRKRDIPISTELADRIRAIPREILTGGNLRKNIPPQMVRPDFIFYSPVGKPWNPSNWFHRCYEPFMSELHAKHPDVPILSPHELRHTRASLLKEQGVDLYDIQKLLGHRDLTMLSRRYLHTDVELLRQHLDLCK